MPLVGPLDVGIDSPNLTTRLPEFARREKHIHRSTEGKKEHYSGKIIISAFKFSFYI